MKLGGQSSYPPAPSILVRRCFELRARALLWIQSTGIRRRSNHLQPIAHRFPIELADG
jgi:hypothetical protein